jgi:hypothetical protein
MRRILIELEDGEWDKLVAQAKRDRRTPQAEAAQLLVDYLEELAPEAAPEHATWGDVERAHRSHRGRRGLAEADSAPGAADAGGALPPEEEVGPVEGHGDGA